MLPLAAKSSNRQDRGKDASDGENHGSKNDAGGHIALVNFAPEIDRMEAIKQPGAGIEKDDPKEGPAHGEQNLEEGFLNHGASITPLKLFQFRDNLASGVFPMLGAPNSAASMTKLAPGRPPKEVLLWPWLLWVLPLLPPLCLLWAAQSPPKALVLRPAGPSTLISEPFPLDAGLLGSPLIQVGATIPKDSFVTYRLELLDPANRAVLALTRDGWRETDTWSEDGVIGSDDESDTGVALQLRSAKNGPHRLRLQMEELTRSNGEPLRAPVVFRAQLARHQFNAPALWATTVVSLVLTTCARVALYGHCRRRHQLELDDPQASLRTDLGPGLVRVAVGVRYGPFSVALDSDSSMPEALQLKLVLRDGLGQVCLLSIDPITSRAHPGHVYWRTLHLRLTERRHLLMQVEVPAGLSCDVDLAQLNLSVEDGVRRPLPLPALEPWNAS